MACFIAVLQYNNAACRKYEPTGDLTKYIPLYKPLSTVLARRRNDGPRVPAPSALEILSSVVAAGTLWTIDV